MFKTTYALLNDMNSAEEYCPLLSDTTSLGKPCLACCDQLYVIEDCTMPFVFPRFDLFFSSQMISIDEFG